MPRALPLLVVLAGGCGFSARGGSVEPPVIDAAGAVDAAIDGPGDGSGAAPARRRKLITFNPAKVSGTQTGFPVWIDLADAAIAARAQADGRDVYFTAADGAGLEHELQVIDAAARHFGAWVLLPSLSASSATTIYVVYGDPVGARAPHPTQVFGADFAAVWHLDDALPATTIADATGTHAGTAMLTAATSRTTGRLGHALAFTGGATDRIEFGNPLASDDPHTISVWVDQAAKLNHTAAIIAMGTPATGQARWLHGHYTPPSSIVASLAIGFYNLDFNPNPPEQLDAAGPTYVTWVFEGNNRKNHVYRNGVEIAAGTFMPGPNPQINTSGTAGYIGYAPSTYGPNNAYDGTIDELRIARVARSAGWIATEFNNQSSPGTFYTLGPELVP